MAWSDLSMMERNAYILTAIKNGIYDRLLIIDSYNKFEEGGDFSAGSLTDALWEASKEESLGPPQHGYKLAHSEEWANAHGYYPDERGHRDDRVKLPAHPTHPSRRSWNGRNEFHLTDLGMEDPNYIMFDMADGGLNPLAHLIYNGATVLPEITVTPQGNYYMNTYDNIKLVPNEFGIGGYLQGLADKAKDTAKKTVDSVKKTIDSTKGLILDIYNNLTLPNIYSFVSGLLEDDPPLSTPNFSPVRRFTDLDLNESVTRLNLKYKDKSLKRAKEDLSKMSKEEVISVQRSLAEQGFFDESLDGKSKKLIEDILRLLVSKGYLNGRKSKSGEYAEVDGIVGNKTITAYNLYNRDRNIDGIAGGRTERAYLKSLGLLELGVNTVSTAGIDGCALWVTKLFEAMYGNRSKQNGVISNAWLMIKNIEDSKGLIVYNIYDLDFDNVRSVPQLKSLTELKIKENPLDYSTVRVGDIVGIYMPSSNMHLVALAEGSTKNTHVGIVTGFNDDGIPIVSHNIQGSYRKDLISNISGSKSGKAKVTSIARPREATSITSSLPFENKDSSVYVEGVLDTNNVLLTYMDSIEGSKEIIGQIFPSVNMNVVLKLALGILLRETGMLQNRVSDLIRREESSIINIPELKNNARNYVRYIKGLDDESKSSDTGKMKFSAFTPAERTMLGIKTTKDLDDPSIAGRAAAYYLAKNTDYFIRLRKQYPELGLTDTDIMALVALSYNLGMNTLLHIGFDKNTQLIDLSEIDAIRLMEDPSYRVKDVNSTNWRYLGSIGEQIYNLTSDGSESYISSALRNSRRVKPVNRHLDGGFTDGTGSTENPIELPELVVEGKRPNWFTRNIVNPVKRFVLLEKETNPIFGQRRVDNYRRAMEANPYFADDHNPLYNLMEVTGYNDLNRMLSGTAMATLRYLKHDVPIKGSLLASNNRLHPNEPRGSAALETYLLPRWLLDRIMRLYGYIPGTPGDYGLVNEAVGDRDLPVWLFAPDADGITRDNLIPIGNPGDMLGAEELIHASSYPKALYYDEKNNRYYIKGWDLNDYGKPASQENSGGSSGAYSDLELMAANALDAIGNPVVVTTGFLRVDPNLVWEEYKANPSKYEKYLLGERNSQFEQTINDIYDAIEWKMARGDYDNNYDQLNLDIESFDNLRFDPNYRKEAVLYNKALDLNPGLLEILKEYEARKNN